MKSDYSTAVDMLQARQLKATKTRVELLKNMLEHSNAIPFSLIQKKLSQYDRVTLYRTLKTFVEKGIIHRALIKPDDTYYALCETHCTHHAHDHSHIHLQCRICGSVSCETTGYNLQMETPMFDIEKINIQIEGVCSSCKTK